MIKKFLKGSLLFMLLMIVGSCFFGSSDKNANVDNVSKVEKESKSMVPQEEAVSKLFADISSEQNNPDGEEKSSLDLLSLVRDDDGKLKTEKGFRIRVPGTEESKIIDNLVYVGKTAGGLKLYVPADKRAISVDTATNSISFIAFCPELNIGMDVNAVDASDLESFKTRSKVTASIDGKSVSFLTKPGDKMHDVLSAAVLVTDTGEELAKTMSKIKESMKGK